MGWIGRRWEGFGRDRRDRKDMGGLGRRWEG